MKKVCIVLAEGFEEIEGLTVVDNLRRAEIEVTMASLEEDLKVRGAHDIVVLAEKPLSAIDLSAYDMLVLPGGGKGTENLSKSQLVKEALDYMQENDRYIAAICAAPSVLGKHGLLKDKKACCYPGFEDKLTGADVVYDGTACAGKILTARAMGYSIDFSLKIIEALTNKAVADKIASSILYRD